MRRATLALLLLGVTALWLGSTAAFFAGPPGSFDILARARRDGTYRPPHLWGRSIARMAAQPCAAMDGEHHRILILGGGTAGVGTAAQLKNEGVTGMSIVEPSETHYYQPLWT